MTCFRDGRLSWSPPRALLKRGKGPQETTFYCLMELPVGTRAHDAAFLGGVLEALPEEATRAAQSAAAAMAQ